MAQTILNVAVGSVITGMTYDMPSGRWLIRIIAPSRKISHQEAVDQACRHGRQWSIGDQLIFSAASAAIRPPVER